MPAQELSFSESIAHWLAIGDSLGEAGQGDGSGEGPAALSLDRPRAESAAGARRRDFALIGGAAALAMVLVWVLHGQAQSRQAQADVEAGVPTIRPAGPAELLTRQAEKALAGGHGEQALSLATQAVKVDPGFPDAYVVIGSAHQSAGQRAEARQAYRRYLELAPLGRYAANLRRLLTLLAD
jgi:tetratricopeptide (TPR) repeat protein